MNSHRITRLMLAMGVPLFLGGGAWLLFGARTHEGIAALAAGVGFALMCFSQAVLALDRRR